jgi:acyl-homoserine-lactone acylase
MITCLNYRLIKISIPFICFSFSIVASAQQKAPEILWDNYGVPHIYAQNETDMYYAFGWSQMHNHANLLLRLYGQSRGRAAEYWGEGHLASDKQVLLFNLTDSAKRHYSLQKGQSKANLDAFVKGLNQYAKSNPDAIEASMKQVLPITAHDVLAHSSRVIGLRFLGGRDIREAAIAGTPGSNAYAIAPSKSASKNAMLVSNPHLAWSDLFTFFEAHLNAPGIHAYGAALVGMPTLNIAFNDNLGWTHTVNTIDATDRYELTLKDDGYVLDGAVEKFNRKTITYKVRQKDGTVKEQKMDLHYAKHGPVVSMKNGKAYAVRIAGLEKGLLNEQYYKMIKAKNLNQFEAALKMMELSMFNVIYADKAGNIMYLFNGNVPVRLEKDAKFWSGVVDGTNSKHIWSRYHAYSELPRVVNPPAGFVQNANDGPWISTYPPVLKAGDFPGYMSPEGMRLRPQRAVNMIFNDRSVTFEELVNYKLNTGVEAADRFLDDLAMAVKLHPDPVAEKAIDILNKWDKTTEVSSKGGVLFGNWFSNMGNAMFSIPWDPAKPLTTPDGLKDPGKAVEVLKKVALEVEKNYGAMDVAWGDVYRFRLGSYDLPANGGPDGYGIFRVIDFSRPEAASGFKGYATSGDTYVAITEFGSKVRARVLLSYGNASQPGSKHIGDQLPLLSEKKLREALLDKKEVLKHLEKREVLN